MYIQIPLIDPVGLSFNGDIPEDVTKFQTIEIDKIDLGVFLNIVNHLRSNYIGEYYDEPEGVLIPYSLYLGLKYTEFDNGWHHLTQQDFPDKVFGLKITPHLSSHIELVANKKHIPTILYKKQQAAKELGESDVKS